MSQRERKEVQLIAEGRQLVTETEQYQRAVGRITAEVDAIYAKQISAASRFRGLLLRFQRGRELRRRLKALLPDEALFVSSSSSQ